MHGLQVGPVRRGGTRSAVVAAVVLGACCLGFAPSAVASIKASLKAEPCFGGQTTATVTVDADVRFFELVDVVLYERDRLTRNDKIAAKKSQPVGNGGKARLTFDFRVVRKDVKELGKTLELFALVTAKKPAGSQFAGGSEKTNTNVVKIVCK
ncbi:MAG: hypothetical protein JNL30_00270 [Rubrivivax sp.]|nr:hypothetical protein [Rubrivivax sp.]